MSCAVACCWMVPTGAWSEAMASACSKPFASQKRKSDPSAFRKSRSYAGFGQTFAASSPVRGDLHFQGVATCFRSGVQPAFAGEGDHLLLRELVFDRMLVGLRV